MSHIHIPDGVLPLSWWGIGYLIAGFFLILAIRKLEKEDLRKKIPYLGVVSAIMLITMSIPLGIVPFHINLTVLMGVLSGPVLGYIAVFIVNLFLSFLGHGGITTVGLNTLILGLEVVIGSLMFSALKRRIKAIPAIAVVTAITLIISTCAMLGVVGLSQSGWEYALPHDHHEHGAEHLADDHSEHDHLANSHLEEEHLGEDHLHSANDETFLGLADLRDSLSHVSFLGMTGFGAVLLILLIGIGLEVLVTILLARFFLKVKPELLK